MARKGNEILRRTATENEFQRSVIRIYEGWGYKVGHNYDSRRERLSGIPDLTCAHRVTKALVILELKKEGEGPTLEQVFMLDCYNQAGVYSKVVDASDLRSGLLEGVARHYASHWGGFDECTVCTKHQTRNN